MKCTNKRKINVVLCLVLLTVMLTGCGGTAYLMPYDPDSPISSFNVLAKPNRDVTNTFASGLCVVTEDINIEGVDMSQAEAAVLFDVNNCRVVYSKNAHERLYPASITKVMTAIVALKYGSMDQMLTASDVVNITEPGAQMCGLKSGDRMTLDQALHILLMYSANDVGMMIAESVGGSVEHFIELMNQEAKALGATNTNFTNPHGLPDDNHYTTAYDLYLMFNAAIQNEVFREIINLTSYQTTFYDKDGKEKTLDFKTTNLYLRGDVETPANVTVIGGKTGTTNAAGHCLILLSKDTAGAPYISIILRSAKREFLYPEMTDLLEEIGK